MLRSQFFVTEISTMTAAKFSALCLLTCLGLVSADVRTVFNKNERYNKAAQLHSVNILNSFMTIVTCNEVSNSELTRKCKVSQIILNNESKSATCEFVLDENLYEPSAHPLSENKAILISQTKKKSDQLYIKYTVFNFPDCKTTETKISFESFRAVDADFDENQDAILINEDNTFDILYNNQKACGNKVCRLTFDAQGNKVSGPVASFVPIVGSYRFVKKVQSSPNFIASELNFGGTYKISLVKPNGQVLLKEYKSFDDWMDHGVSTSHKSIRICSKTNTTKVECELLDGTGKVTSKINIEAGQKVETIAVQNLANGEFLLLVEDDETGAKVMKVKGDGSVTGFAKLSRFVRGSYSKYESYVDVNGNQYCVTRASHSHGNLKVLKECSADNDFH